MKKIKFKWITGLFMLLLTISISAYSTPQRLDTGTDTGTELCPRQCQGSCHDAIAQVEAVPVHAVVADYAYRVHSDHYRYLVMRDDDGGGTGTEATATTTTNSTTTAAIDTSGNDGPVDPRTGDPDSYKLFWNSPFTMWFFVLLITGWIATTLKLNNGKATVPILSAIVSFAMNIYGDWMDLGLYAGSGPGVSDWQSVIAYSIVAWALSNGFAKADAARGFLVLIKVRPPVA